MTKIVNPSSGISSEPYEFLDLDGLIYGAVEALADAIENNL